MHGAAGRAPLLPETVRYGSSHGSKNAVSNGQFAGRQKGKIEMFEQLLLHGG